MNFQYEKERIFASDKTGKIIALITWHFTENVAVVDHTFVDESLRGQGVASLLMKEAVAFFRKENYNTYGTCSYADVWYAKHKDELEDILVERPLDEAVACKISH